jgi:DNA-binding beta-propeller fold protein YncE
MPSDGLDGVTPGAPDSGRPISTGGAMARARRRRIALLAALCAALAVLTYAAYYYVQNRRLPIPQVVASAQTVDPPHYLYSFSGTAKQAMTLPTGIGIIGNRVYVTDFAYRTVRAYTTDGAYLFDFGPIADGKNVRLDSPVHIAIGPDDTVWVTDRALKGIYVFDENGKYLRKFVPNGDPAFAWAPLSLAFGPEGDLYVTDVGDSSKHRVLVFDVAGQLLHEWGATKQVENANDAPGDFLFPNGLAVTGTGTNAIVYVADGNNRRVQVFSGDGAFLRIINTSGTPRGLALDSQKRLYVVDALSHRVDLYSNKGVSIADFGENGVGPGQFSFPNDIAIDGRGRMFVTDRENNRVQVWSYSVADIPGVTRVTPGSAWILLVPFALLLLPVAARRRRFVVTPDFVEGMIAADLVPRMTQGRTRWVMTERDRPAFDGRMAGGVALADVLHAEPYSTTDAGLIREHLSVAEDRAALLAMAKRYHILCTEDPELAAQAAGLGIDVYDRAAWLARFGKKRR